MFKTLRLKNFKCFADANLEDLRTINVIVGDNGSGKTALLESLLFLASNSVQATWAASAWRGVYKANTVIPLSEQSFYSIWEDLFHKFDVENVISIEHEDAQRNARKLEIYFGSQRPDKQQVLVDPLAERKRENIINFNWAVNATPYPTRFWLDPTGKPRESGHFRVAESAVFISPANLSPDKDLVRYTALSQKLRLKEFVTALQTEYPHLQDIRIEYPTKHATLVAEMDNMSRTVPIGLVSAGFAKTIRTLLAIISVPKGVVLIDEIETGIYYKRLNSLWRMVHHWCKQFKCQAFISTHSDECLDALKEVVAKDPDDFCLIRAEKNNGCTQIKQIPGANFAKALDYDIELR